MNQTKTRNPCGSKHFVRKMTSWCVEVDRSRYEKHKTNAHADAADGSHNRTYGMVNDLMYAIDNSIAMLRSCGLGHMLENTAACSQHIPQQVQKESMMQITPTNLV
jgi:hypothetical protein